MQLKREAIHVNQDLVPQTTFCFDVLESLFRLFRLKRGTPWTSLCMYSHTLALLWWNETWVGVPVVFAPQARSIEAAAMNDPSSQVSKRAPVVDADSRNTVQSH